MWIDKCIGWFSPAAQFKRARYRAAISEIRKYEGAAKSRRTVGWKTGSSSAISEISAALPILRNRSRDLVRNNPYAARGIALIATNVVGKGIMPHFSSATPAAADSARQLWKSWAETPNIDYDGVHNIYSMQRLVKRSVVESGEVLIRRWRTTDEFPLRLQVLESDFISTTVTQFGENRVIQGIEFDAQGRRVAYHLYKDHPGNTGINSPRGFTSLETVRIPAEDILHIFRIDRPGQIRGVPWLAPVMIRLRDFDEYEDAQLVRQKIAACFSVFISDIEAPETPLTDTQKEELGEKVEPGQIEILPPGKTVHFASPPGAGEEYDNYTATVLRAISVGLGVSYETLAGDLSKVNFSSARMGWLEFGRNIDSWRVHVLNPLMNDPIFQWFKNTAAILGQTADDLTAHWSAPKRQMIDPTKEIPAKIKAIRGGIETLSDVIREGGSHPDDHFAKIKADNETIDRLDLVLDSDPRKVNAAGKAQEDDFTEGE